MVRLLGYLRMKRATVPASLISQNQKGRDNVKLFRATTKVNASQYVDWYEVDSKEEAEKLWAEDREKYGLPEDATVEIDECDPKTFNPIGLVKRQK
jgi:hypothetical protein